MRTIETQAFSPNTDFRPSDAVNMLVDAERRRIETSLNIPSRDVKLQRVQQAQVNHIIKEVMLFRDVERDFRSPDRAVFAIQNQFDQQDRARDAVGGIDLNPAMLSLQIRRDGNGIPLPIEEQPLENMEIRGFVPVIINITPVPNLPALIGQAGGGGGSAQLAQL